MIVPQVYLFEPGELALQLGGDKKKGGVGIFIPLLFSLGLTVFAGLPQDSWSSPHSNTPSGIFQDKLDQVMSSTTDNLLSPSSDR